MPWQAKFKAFVSHALFSAVIVSIFFIVTRSFWYPAVLFDLENVWEALRILVPVDAVLGPVLTFYLWHPGKPGVKFDIGVVLVLQVAALLYGAHTIYQQRPVVFAFAADRFEVIPASQFDQARLDASLFSSPLPEPLPVYALPAQHREEQNAFVLGGVQYQQMPERYRPMQDHAQDWQSRALQWQYIQPEGDGLAVWEAFRQQYTPEDTCLFRLQGTTGEAMMVAVNTRGEIVDYLALDPWAVYKEPVRTNP